MHFERKPPLLLPLPLGEGRGEGSHSLSPRERAGVRVLDSLSPRERAGVRVLQSLRKTKNRTYMTHTTDDIAQLFPDIMAITDSSLRDQVATVWDNAITTGCGGKGWTFDELRTIKFTLLAGDIDMKFAEHLNSCVKQCMAIADVLGSVFGDRVPINRDYLIAGALLADVGKLLEFDKDAAGNVIKGSFGEALRHPFSGVALCYWQVFPM